VLQRKAEPWRRFAVRVEVRLFAVARHRAGRATVSVELPEGATVADLKRVLAEAHPELAAMVPHFLIALDAEYAADDRPVPPGAEVAAIPPVSGGSCP
jgi:molybdopterin converting factor subunit 1